MHEHHGGRSYRDTSLIKNSLHRDIRARAPEASPSSSIYLCFTRLSRQNDEAVSQFPCGLVQLLQLLERTRSVNRSEAELLFRGGPVPDVRTRRANATGLRLGHKLREYARIRLPHLFHCLCLSFSFSPSLSLFLSFSLAISLCFRG